MFRKKGIYIVGIFVFTLVLLADLAIYFLLPVGGGRGNIPGDFGTGDFAQGNFGSFGDFDGEMPEDGADFTMPEGFDGQSFDPGSMGGQRPSGFDSENFGGNMPGGFDTEEITGQMSDTVQIGGLMGVLTAVRSTFWPILIVCVLGDILCIVMLIRVMKKNKQNPPLPGYSEEDEEDFEKRRGNGGNIFLSLIAIVLVAAVTISSLPTGESGGEMTAEKNVLEQAAATKDIASVFSGSGTLESKTAVSVEIPQSVSITSYLVKNGDVVTEGALIAEVDKNSVLLAMSEVQTMMDELDAELVEIQDAMLDDTVESHADGRVKEIYAAEGDSVAAVMAEKGALMLISLGGSMTVVIQSEAKVRVGQTLAVTLSDGTEIEGKVQQTKMGEITITVTDKDTAQGDAVTVTDEEGTLLGTGTLEISSPMKIVAYAGTVEDIKVEVNDLVDVGDTLLTLEDTEDVARYQQLMRDRETLSTQLNQLNQMYRDGGIRAEKAGIVSQLGSNESLSAQTDENGTAAMVSSSTSRTSDVVLMSISTLPDRAVNTQLMGLINLQEIESGSQEESSPEESSAQESSSETESSSEEFSSETESSSEESSSEQESSTEESTPEETLPDGQSPGGAGQLPADPNDPPIQDGPQEDGTYAGKITKVSYGSLTIQISETNMTGLLISALDTMDETLFDSTREYKPALTVPVEEYLEGQMKPSDVNALGKNDKVLLYITAGELVKIEFIDEAETDGSGQGTYPDGMGGMGNMEGSGFPGGMSGGMGDFSGMGSYPGGMTGGSGGDMTGATGGDTSGGTSQMPSGGDFGSMQQPTEEEEEEEAIYEIETTSFCSILAAEVMTIQISVDERDILSIAVGQNVIITLDALPGQSFSGRVTRINPVGTNDGGSTKYTIIVETSRTEKMLEGMNAAISIEVSRLKDALTVPAAAVYEDGNRTYVYTDVDEETGELINPVNVTTGASDGTDVEILSGLSEGDAVYYEYADSLVYRLNQVK